MSSYQEILNAKQTIQRDLGAVDILVNNAGLLPKFSLLETDIKNLEKVVQVNLLAHFWVRNSYKSVKTEIIPRGTEELKKRLKLKEANSVEIFWKKSSGFLLNEHTLSAMKNFLIIFQTIRVFIEDMIKKRSGHIVGVSSMLAFYPSSRTIVYTATKYGVRGLMESLARELHEDKVNVKTLLVLPHLTNTRKELMDHTRVAMG